MNYLLRPTHVSAFTSFAAATLKATRKTALTLFSVAVLLAGGTSAVRGQSALDGFDPNANGVVRVAVVQPDGKVLLGGDFTSILGVTRNRIARLNPDGTLDIAFDPNATIAPGDYPPHVYSIAVQADGKILVGGTFDTIGGQPRNAIARLDTTTGLADSFDPNAIGFGYPPFVYSIAVQSDGKILVGGFFTSIGGQTRNYIARLDATTGLVDSFNPNPDGTVYTIAVQADGKILVGGVFGSIGNLRRVAMARLDPTTGLADSFRPNPRDGGPFEGPSVSSIKLQADGKIFAGGNFASIGGQPRNGLARLDPETGQPDSFNPGSGAIVVQADGKILLGRGNTIVRLDPTTGLADSFNPNVATGNIFPLAVQADGKILVGGVFTTIGGQTRNNIARLETDGRLDQTLNLNTIGDIVICTAVQPDGKIILGGRFSSVLGVTRNNIARLNTDGTLDTAFDPNANSVVNAIAVQADGKILVGGFFGFIGGQGRSRIARLDATTGLADSFDPNADSTIYAIALLADGKILAAGEFSSIGGKTRNRIARLDATTGGADSFNPNANGRVYSVAVQADGKILASGLFNGENSIGGQMRNRIARLDPTSGLADSFNPNADNNVHSIAIQPDGKILAGGSFTSIGEQMRLRMARLDPVTGLADSFDPNAGFTVYSIVVQADGKILVGGAFTSIGGQMRNYIARLYAATGLADSFDPNANGTVNAIAVPADGKILAGGFFNIIDGQSRNTFARLSNDTAALQKLAATQTAVSWTRGGSSVQFTRVTFEYSTDNVTYTPLGNGTAAGNNWTLTGLNLPTGQNIYIRARGYYRCGFSNGSESIMESVRNAFILLAPTQVVSRKIHGGAGPFDLNLPITGTPGIECRSGGASGDYQLIFSFVNTLTSVGNASVTSGMGSVSSHMIGTDAHNYIVNLTGVSNAAAITVSLANVNDSAGNSRSSVPTSMGVLVGDSNGDGIVNAGDVLQTRTRSGQATDLTNFRSDVTADGFVNTGDTTVVRAQSGTFLP